MAAGQVKKQGPTIPADARTYLMVVILLGAALVWCGFMTHGSSANLFGTRKYFSRAAAATADNPIGPSLFGSDSLKAASRSLDSRLSSSSSSSAGSVSTSTCEPCRCNATSADSSRGTANSSANSSMSTSVAGNSTLTARSNGSSADAAQHERVVPDLQSYNKDILVDVAYKVLQLERQGKGRKVISMSLYGNDTRYTYGAVENALMVKRGWPGWTLRYYVGEGVPEDILETVRLLGGEIVSAQTFQSKASSLMWRFFVMSDPTVTRYIIRDVNARLTPRDFYAVKEWMSTKHLFHIMRDDFFHGNPIMGGMWGAVNGLLHPRILQPYQAKESNATQAEEKYKWNMDQVWLSKVVYPGVRNHTLLHASWHCKKYGAEAEWRGFPTQRVSDRDFVGNVYWGMNDFLGRTCSGVCPAECRRKPEWKNC